MSQIYDSNKPQSGVTTMTQLYQIIRDHFATVISAFSGTTFPINPVIGQPCFKTDEIKWYKYTGDPAKGTNGWVEDITALSSYMTELINARGSKSGLDQRLNVALNLDGTLKASTTLNPSQWMLLSLTFNYVSANSFTVNGNQTDIYVSTRRIKGNLSGSTIYSEVLSSSYNAGTNLTTVSILDAVLNNTLVSVEYSLVSPVQNNGALSTAMLGLYIFTQATAAQVWTIAHNYNRPNITSVWAYQEYTGKFCGDGSYCGDTSYCGQTSGNTYKDIPYSWIKRVDANTVKIGFDAPQSGKATILF